MARLEHDKVCGRLIREVNPRCEEDVLTDRWPDGDRDQDLMIDDLRDFVAKMHLLRTGDQSIDKVRLLLEGLFGDRPAKSAVHDYMFGAGRTHVEYGTGRIVRPAGGLVVAAPMVGPVPAHDFFGDD